MHIIFRKRAIWNSFSAKEPYKQWLEEPCTWRRGSIECLPDIHGRRSSWIMCCSVMQCVAVWCSMLYCIAVSCSVSFVDQKLRLPECCIWVLYTFVISPPMGVMGVKWVLYMCYGCSRVICVLWVLRVLVSPSSFLYRVAKTHRMPHCLTACVFWSQSPIILVQRCSVGLKPHHKFWESQHCANLDVY